MKWVKVYLVVATLMLMAALGAGVYVWYVYQSVRTPDSVPQGGTPSEEVIVSEQENALDDSPVTDATTVTPAQVEEPVVIDATKLTDAQRDILKSFGYTGDSITISQAVVMCAENALGSMRFNEILNGSAPSPLEALKLVPCMKK